MQLFRNPVILLVLIVLAFLLFGANKLPKMARNMGQSMRILKSEVKEMKTEDSTTKQDNAQESESQDGTTPVEGTVISNSENTAKPDSEEQPSK
ncbi:MAG TPA: Sec-independent protein translocase subunit TatA [Candidatus Yaniella excrementigallinarum]|nr:Sec-independent protein translocase subunit TatA [Candidatus Yaniella excrementigallinarum]